MIYFAIVSTILSLNALGPESFPAESERVADGVEVFELSVSHSHDRSRINVAVFNTRANNARAITSYNQAERLGDLVVSLDGDDTKSSALRNNYTTPREIVWQWVSAGNGFGWSLPLDFFQTRYSLSPGCYQMKFSYTNDAAVSLGQSMGAGPRAVATTDELRVCFERKKSKRD